MAAQLEHADVSRNPPAILRRDARRIAIHPSKSVGHPFEEMPGWSLAQPVNVVRRRLRKPALDDHAVACAGVVMARRAKDVEFLAPALQIGGSNRQWKFVRNQDG